MLNALIGMSRESLLQTGYSTMRSSRMLYILPFLVMLTVTIGFVLYTAQRMAAYSAQEYLEINVPSTEAEQLQNLFTKPLVLPLDESRSQSQSGETSATVDVNVNSSDPKSPATSGTMTVDGKSVELNSNGSTHKSITTTNNDGATAVDISISSDSSGSENSEFNLKIHSESEVRMKSSN